MSLQRDLTIPSRICSFCEEKMAWNRAGPGVRQSGCPGQTLKGPPSQQMQNQCSQTGVSAFLDFPGQAPWLVCLAWSKAFCPFSCLLLAPSDVGSQAVWVQSPGLAISLFRCFMCTVRAPHNPQGGLHAARLLLCVLAFSLHCCKLNVYFPFSWAFLTQYSAVLRVRPHFLG